LQNIKSYVGRGTNTWCF